MSNNDSNCILILSVDNVRSEVLVGITPCWLGSTWLCIVISPLSINYKAASVTLRKYRHHTPAGRRRDQHTRLRLAVIKSEEMSSSRVERDKSVLCLMSPSHYLHLPSARRSKPDDNKMIKDIEGFIFISLFIFVVCGPCYTDMWTADWWTYHWLRNIRSGHPNSSLHHQLLSLVTRQPTLSTNRRLSMNNVHINIYDICML